MTEKINCAIVAMLDLLLYDSNIRHDYVHVLQNMSVSRLCAVDVSFDPVIPAVCTIGF